MRYSASVFEHMNPYQRLNHYIKGILYKIDGDIKQLEEEIAMWAVPEVVLILGKEDTMKLAASTCGELESLRILRKSWEDRATKMHYCIQCDGHGWWWSCVSQDESVRVQCHLCDGTGMSKEAKMEPPPVPAPPKKMLDTMMAIVGRKFR